MSTARVLATAKDNKGRTVMQFIVPGADNDGLSLALRVLTYQLRQTQGVEAVGGGFGGEYGYGVEFENDVFFMCPDYMDVSCDCGRDSDFDAWLKGKDHAPKCYSTEVGKLCDEIRKKHRPGIDAALEARDKHRWLSKESERAQKLVNRLSDAEDREDRAMRQALCRKHRIPWNKGWASMWSSSGA